MSLFCLPNKMADLDGNVLQKEPDEQFPKMKKILLDARNA